MSTDGLTEYVILAVVLEVFVNVITGIVSPDDKVGSYPEIVESATIEMEYSVFGMSETNSIKVV